MKPVIVKPVSPRTVGLLPGAALALVLTGCAATGNFSSAVNAPVEPAPNTTTVGKFQFSVAHDRRNDTSIISVTDTSQKLTNGAPYTYTVKAVQKKGEKARFEISGIFPDEQNVLGSQFPYFGLVWTFEEGDKPGQPFKMTNIAFAEGTPEKIKKTYYLDKASIADRQRRMAAGEIGFGPLVDLSDHAAATGRAATIGRHLLDIVCQNAKAILGFSAVDGVRQPVIDSSGKIYTGTKDANMSASMVNNGNRVDLTVSFRNPAFSGGEYRKNLGFGKSTNETWSFEEFLGKFAADVAKQGAPHFAQLSPDALTMLCRPLLVKALMEGVASNSDPKALARIVEKDEFCLAPGIVVAKINLPKNIRTLEDLKRWVDVGLKTFSGFLNEQKAQQTSSLKAEGKKTLADLGKSWGAGGKKAKPTRKAKRTMVAERNVPTLGRS